MANKSNQNKNKLYLQDNSPIEGIFSDFVYLKSNEIVTIIKVSGINLDLLAEYESTQLFEDYGVFTMQTANYRLENINMTIPLDIQKYNFSWKKRYIESQKDDTVNPQLRQLIASYVDNLSEIETDTEMSTKQHLIAIAEPVKKRTVVELRLAEKTLKEKTKEIIRGLKSLFERYDSEIEVLNGTEILKVLYRFIDLKSSTYSI